MTVRDLLKKNKNDKCIIRYIHPKTGRVKQIYPNHKVLKGMSMSYSALMFMSKAVLKKKLSHMDTMNTEYYI